MPNPLDRKLAPYLKQACREEGVKPPRRIHETWWHSPDGVIGLFPEWFAAAQADWPPQTKLLGFPLYDLRDQSELSPELERFLAAGTSPVLFTPGTAMKHGHLFFETALEACRLAGLRALLVTKHPEHLPAPLPETVLHCDYVPFSQILPHCAALVSHGGIGTVSQGLAAGVPQLLMPMTHDQPDNLNRLRRLGVAGGLYPDRFTPERVADALKRLIGDPKTQEACRVWSQRLKETDNAEAVVRYLEGK
jgi:UDP:flavonoid glycosyltransferase YjiC (YdhE family)